MSECNHDCSSCGQACDSRKPESLLEKPHEQSHIQKVIGICSGKGGVGKSMVTALLAVLAQLPAGTFGKLRTLSAFQRNASR